ncbi:hypothetical protein H9Y04_07790 [Streptomyces sp. TRM66268-LWL]|uniref:Uncharacterized protein n=1 Tax=Streptomyces polyasparticus TaxID=2767826 RepID=A0ABR7SBW8_9ACTN|nr:hypothetical protein [Streptomyces polyasparticus]
MKIEIPADATEAKGAVRVNPQEDQYLLSFVTSTTQAKATADLLHAEDPLSSTHKGTASGEVFKHLGLPAPESLNPVQWTGVCPPCVSDASRSAFQWIEIYVEPLPSEKARVYLQAF